MADTTFERGQQLGQPQKEYMFEFKVLNVPAISDIRDIPLYCQGAETPEKSFSEIELPWLQHTLLRPGKVTKHGSISVTFKLQADMFIQEAMRDWANAITDNQEGAGDAIDQWIGQCELTMLDDRSDQASNELYRYTLQDSFLLTNPSKSFDMSGDSNVTFDADIAYSSFTEETIS
jgi:hypothetical protein